MWQKDARLSAPVAHDGEKALLWLVLAVVLGVAVGILAGTVITSVKWVFLVIAGGVVIASLARLEWALMGLVFLTYANVSDTVTNYQNAPPVAKFYVIAILAVILFRWLAKGERFAGRADVTLALIAYGLVSFLSVFYADNIDAVIATSIEYAKDMLITATIVMLLVKGSTLRKVLWTLVLSGLFLSAATIFQYVTETYPIAVGGFARAEVHQIVAGSNSNRHAGPMDDANHFGQILVVLVPLALERALNESSRALRVVALAALLCLIIATLLTYSRGAILALLGMGAVYFWIYRAHLKGLVVTVVIAAGIAFAALQFAPPEFFDRMETLTRLVPGSAKSSGVVLDKGVDVAIEGRLAEMQVAWQMFLDHPFFGVGYGNYESHYQKYELLMRLPARHEKRSAHSFFLEIAAEQGLLGLGAMALIVWLMVQSVMDAVRLFSHMGRPEYTSMAIAIGIGLLGYGIAAMFLHNSYSRYLWLMAGVAFSLPNIARQEQASEQASDV